MSNKKLLIEYQIDFNRRSCASKGNCDGESLPSILTSQKSLSISTKARQSSDIFEGLTTPALQKEQECPYSPVTNTVNLTPKAFALRSLPKRKPSPVKNGLGAATINSFVRASNGMFRDIDRFLKKDYHPITQPSWNDRFVYEKPLQPPKTPSPMKRRIKSDFDDLFYKQDDGVNSEK